MNRKTLLASLLGLALLAGPLAASCASCCPPIEGRAAVATAGCCDCAQTIERPSTPDSSVSGRCVSPEALVLAAQPVHIAGAGAGVLLRGLAGSLVFTPTSPPTPRRL